MNALADLAELYPELSERSLINILEPNSVSNNSDCTDGIRPSPQKFVHNYSAVFRSPRKNSESSEDDTAFEECKYNYS